MEAAAPGVFSSVRQPASSGETERRQAGAAPSHAAKPKATGARREGQKSEAPRHAASSASASFASPRQTPPSLAPGWRRQVARQNCRADAAPSRFPGPHAGGMPGMARRAATREVARPNVQRIPSARGNDSSGSPVILSRHASMALSQEPPARVRDSTAFARPRQRRRAYRCRRRELATRVRRAAACRRVRARAKQEAAVLRRQRSSPPARPATVRPRMRMVRGCREAVSVRQRKAGRSPPRRVFRCLSPAHQRPTRSSGVRRSSTRQRRQRRRTLVGRSAQK